MKPTARPKSVKSVSLQNAVFAYVSACCSTLAEKPACKDNGGALGTWRCSQCRKVCKVRPTSKEPFTSKKVEPVQGEAAL